MNQLESYLEIILNERNGSWPIFAILIVCLGFMIRCLVLKPVLRRAKEVGRKDYLQVKREYLKRSLWGWLFFVIAVILSVELWCQNLNVELASEEIVIFLAAFFSFCISLMFHLMALASASFVVLAKHSPEL